MATQTEEDKTTETIEEPSTVEEGIETDTGEGEDALDIGDLELDYDYEDETSDDDSKTTADLDEKEQEEDDEEIEDKSDDDEDLESEGQETDEDEGGEDTGDDEPEPRIVDTIAERTGLEFEEGELDDIDDTEDGVIELSERIAEKRSQQQIDEYLEDHPMTKKLMEFEQMGGDPEEFRDAFLPETDYQQVSVQEDNIEQQKEIIKDSLKEKGFSKERIERNIELYEDGGMLYEEAQDSLQELRSSQEQQKEELMEQQEREFEQAQEQAEKVWNQVTETIQENDTFNNIPLPKKDKSKFQEFITPDEESGMSPRDKKAQELSLEDQLTIDLILYHGLDSFADIIDSKAKTKKTKSLKEQLKKNKDRNKSDDQDASNNQASAEDLEMRFD